MRRVEIIIGWDKKYHLQLCQQIATNYMMGDRGKACDQMLEELEQSKIQQYDLQSMASPESLLHADPNAGKPRQALVSQVETRTASWVMRAAVMDRAGGSRITSLDKTYTSIRRGAHARLYSISLIGRE